MPISLSVVLEIKKLLRFEQGYPSVTNLLYMNCAYISDVLVLGLYMWAQCVWLVLKEIAKHAPHRSILRDKDIGTRLGDRYLMEWRSSEVCASGRSDMRAYFFGTSR